MQVQSHRSHTMKSPLWYVDALVNKSTALLKVNSLTATFIEYSRVNLHCMLTKMRKPPPTSCGTEQMKWWIQTDLATSTRP